jgi:hypothetical protein
MRRRAAGADFSRSRSDGQEMPPVKCTTPRFLEESMGSIVYRCISTVRTTSAGCVRHRSIEPPLKVAGLKPGEGQIQLEQDGHSTRREATQRSGSRRQESQSEGEEEPAAAEAKRFRMIRRAVAPASGRAARRCAKGADHPEPRSDVWSGKRGSNPRHPPPRDGPIPRAVASGERRARAAPSHQRMPRPA